MGIFFWPMEVLSDDKRLTTTVEAMVDTGSSYTVLPSEVLAQLGIDPAETQMFEMGDGRVVNLDSGVAWVRVEGQEVIGVVVFGGEGTTPLMGAELLQSAGLLVDPGAHRLIPRSSLL